MLQVDQAKTDLKAFINERATDQFYLDPAWLDMITSLYGYQFIPLTALNSDGHLSGFLPLCYMRSPLTGKRLVSLPFSDYCPMLADDAKSANHLLDQAIELAKRKQVRYLELRTGQNETLAGRTDLASANLYARWLVQLEANTDAAWGRTRQQARRKVKKARSEGVQIRIAESREDMREYYRLHLLTRTKKHGMPSQPLKFFFNLWDTFGRDNKIHLEMAEYKGEIIAAHITAFYGKHARYMYGASDERFQDLGAGHLITWESIAWGCQNGYTQLDLGRTAYDNPGLVQFKRSWGASEEASPYYYYPTIQGLATTQESSKKYQLMTSCWRNLPLQISAPLGGYLYRHLG